MGAKDFGEDTKVFLEKVGNETVTGAYFGLVLTSALAWNEVFRTIITQYFVRNGKGGIIPLILYALSTTIFTAAFLTLTNARKTLRKDFR
jgi:hypothetical protein